MSIVRSIRERSSWVVGVVGIALLLFIIGDDIFRNLSNLVGGNSQTIGQINGESIDSQEFAKSLENARLNFEASSGRSPQEDEMKSLREQVWQNFVFEKAYTKQYKALGLTVSSEELVDMVQGNNIHASIKQQFVNQQTGQFDKNQVVAYLKTLNTAPEAQQLQWKNFEASLQKQRLSEKYTNMLNLSNYVSNLEAKKEHEALEARADGKYLVVPFYSIADSSIKVSDSQIEDYYAKNKVLFKGTDSRTFEYASFQVAPSKKDSADLYEDIKQSAKDLAVASNDSAFAATRSELRMPYRIATSNMPEGMRSLLPTMQVGGVYGPIKDGNAYSIFKYDGEVRDSLSTARASHILIAKNGANAEANVAARAQAESLLSQIKGGANFEQLAMQFSADGSKQAGGDLGAFQNNGTMVKPFEAAVFGQASAGLIPNLVETDYGFHIIKVTEARSNVKHKIATISKVLAPSESTKNEIYQTVEGIRSSSKSKADLVAALKKSGKATLLTADRVQPEASAFGTIQNGREVVMSMFSSDAKVDRVADKIFEIGDQYLIAVLTGSTSKDSPKATDFKDAISFRVKNQLKAEQIIKKLGTPTGTLEQIAAKYGAGALVETATDINLNSTLTSPGPDPVGLGSIVGGKVGKRSKVLKADFGVFITETTRAVNAPEIADYSQYKLGIAQKNAGSAAYMADQVIRDAAKIKDNRYKFY